MRKLVDKLINWLYYRSAKRIFKLPFYFKIGKYELCLYAMNLDWESLRIKIRYDRCKNLYIKERGLLMEKIIKNPFKRWFVKKFKPRYYLRMLFFEWLYYGHQLMVSVFKNNSKDLNRFLSNYKTKETTEEYKWNIEE